MFCYCFILNNAKKSRAFCGTDDLQKWVTYLVVNRKAFSVFLYFQSFHGRPTEKKVPSRTNISVVIFLSPCSKKPVPGTTDTKTATQTPTFQVKLKGLNGGEVLEICPNFFSFDYETTLQYSARGFFSHCNYWNPKQIFASLILLNVPDTTNRRQWPVGAADVTLTAASLCNAK